MSPCCSTLQVSLGYVLPTLMVWQGQVAAAREWAAATAEQQLQAAPPSPRAAAERRPAAPLSAAHAELQRSWYTRVCVPVLAVADGCPGGWGVCVFLSGMIGGYLAAVLVEPQCPGAGA